MAQLNPVRQNHVSVILPYYNRVDVLGDAVRSVLGQDHQELSLILVDDGSTDGSGELARSFDDPRIIHASTRGREGACAARNVGLRIADSTLVAFQDSDDVWFPTKLSQQVTALRDAQSSGVNAGIVGCGWRLIGQAGPGGDFLPGPHTRREVLADRVRGIGTPMLLVDRDRLGLVEFDEHMPAKQDWDFVLGGLGRDDVVVIQPEVLVKVRRGRSDHVARPINAARAYERVLLKYADDLKTEPALISWLHFRAARDFAQARLVRDTFKHWRGIGRMHGFRRSFHLLCGLVAGRKGLALASRVLPLPPSPSSP